jgi:hypothetical protein
MALQRNKVGPRLQERLAAVAVELRQLMYGGEGVPEWGTSFAALEADGMAIGLELARLAIEQSAASQAEQVPAEALEVEGKPTQPAGTRRRTVLTEAGDIAWDEPRVYLKTARRAFFPSSQGVGDERRQHVVTDPGAESGGAGDAAVVVS